MKLTFFILNYIWFCVAFSSVVLAEHIEHFEVNITIEPSGEFIVTESILYDFNQTKKHGIYREIPTQAYTLGNVNAQIWGGWFNIELDDFTVQMDAKTVEWIKSKQSKKGDKVLHIRIGSNTTFVSGKHLYMIRYRCRNAIMPSSFKKNIDKFHWNAIGDGWSVPILQSEANLFLPKRLDKDTISFPSAQKEKRVEWIDEHHLLFTTSASHLSLFIEFPRGILLQSGEVKIKQGIEFVQHIADKKAKQEAKNRRMQEELNTLKALTKENQKMYGMWYWILFALLTSIIWLRKDVLGLIEDKRSIVVRYEPPEGLTVLQAGILLDKNADNEDFYASIVELAYLGYIQIEESKDGILLQKLHKSTEYLSKDQKQILKALFYQRDRFSSKEMKSIDYRLLYQNIMQINNALYNWMVKEKYSIKHLVKSKSLFLKITLAIVVPFIVFTLFIALNKHYSTQELSYNIFSVFVALTPAFLVSFFRTTLWVKIVVSLMGVGLWILLMQLNLLPTQRGMGLIDIFESYITAMMMIVILLFVVYKKMGCYTAKGVDAVHYLKGLKVFIRSVKEDELKRRLVAQPDYIEKMLPYAMLFGQVEHWLEMYDLLNVPPPKLSKGSLNKALHHKFLHTTKNAKGIKINTPSYGGTSSSISSFSRGGAGGGGGGSW